MRFESSPELLYQLNHKEGERHTEETNSRDLGVDDHPENQEMGGRSGRVPNEHEDRTGYQLYSYHEEGRAYTTVGKNWVSLVILFVSFDGEKKSCELT
jgi:hypothetical protein